MSLRDDTLYPSFVKTTEFYSELLEMRCTKVYTFCVLSNIIIIK